MGFKTKSRIPKIELSKGQRIAQEYKLGTANTIVSPDGKTKNLDATYAEVKARE